MIASDDTNDDPWIDRDFDQEVRETAYFLWESDGQPPGREQHYWFIALERCLLRRQSDQQLERGPPGD